MLWVFQEDHKWHQFNLNQRCVFNNSLVREENLGIIFLYPPSCQQILLGDKEGTVVIEEEQLCLTVKEERYHFESHYFSSFVTLLTKFCKMSSWIRFKLVVWKGMCVCVVGFPSCQYSKECFIFDRWKVTRSCKSSGIITGLCCNWKVNEVVKAIVCL